MPTILEAIFNAFRKASARGVLPTSLGTAELRELGAGILARSVFTARGTNAVFVSKLKEVVDAIAAGDMDEATARVTLLETLRATGYTPEGGFPAALPGEVPPAVRGTLQDLSSGRRLSLIVETQRQLVQGGGLQVRGSSPARLGQFPAWELVRVGSRRAPRNWGGDFQGVPPRGHDPRPRWIIAGGRMTQGRMIALKGDPVWGELGSAENFEDALSVDHPPFAFNSGMGWRELDRGEVARLGIRGPRGETVAEFHGGEARPQTLAGPLPQISTRDMDPEIRRNFEQNADAVTVDGTTVPRSRAEEIRRRMADRLKQSTAARQAEYAGRGA